METFLQQYGVAILTVIIIAMLILIATPIGTLIRDNLQGVINHFVDISNSAISNGDWQGMGNFNNR